MKRLLIIAGFFISCSCVTKNKYINNNVESKSDILIQEPFEKSNKLNDSTNLIYIGKEYRGEIKGYKNWGGQLYSLIKNNEEIELKEKYSFSMFSNNKSFICSLEKIVTGNKIILDTVVISKTMTLVSSCDYFLDQDTVLSPVFSVVSKEDTSIEFYKKTHKSWSVDFEKEKFIMVDSSKVKCLNESD